MRHCLLHHPRRLHHLRQKHLSRSKQITHHIHAGHQRTFYDLDRVIRLQSRLLSVFHNIGVDAPHQGMSEPLLHRTLSPSKILHLNSGAARHILCHGNQSLTRIGAAVKHHILHRLTQVDRNLVVHTKLAGIYNAHVHARLHRPIKEHRVDRLAHRIIATERK